jgi:tetratricopeptide (TPR) repeat protein
MNKQELLKQADYTFQRGNRELAKKYLSDFLAAYPNDESAWMLLAKIEDEKERKAQCYQRVLKINPNNNEAKIGLIRINSVSATLPLPKRQKTIPIPLQGKPNPFRNMYTGIFIAVFIFLLAGTTSFVIARNNPNSQLAKLNVFATPTVYVSTELDNDVAPQTRAEVSEQYPQYAPLVDALIGYAIANAENGMEGAPERPGGEIVVSEQSSMEAKSIIENALPQAGSLSSITITEGQVTSWLASEMKNSPDLPLSDVQVFLRNGQVQVWGMVNGSADSTSVLIVAEIKIDNNQQPYFVIESMQIGTQVVPDLLLGQMELWLNQMLIENINEQLPGLQMMNVNVVNGLITVSGMR